LQLVLTFMHIWPFVVERKSMSHILLFIVERKKLKQREKQREQTTMRM